MTSAYPNEEPDVWKYRLGVTALRDTTDQHTSALGWDVVAPFGTLTFTNIDTRFGPEHPNITEHPAPTRPAMTSAGLALHDNSLTVHTYIASAITVLGALLLGDLVILSHLRDRPAIVGDSGEDLS